jgi:hypothetical protein
VFRVPVDGELVSMCEVNALGLGERYDASLRDREDSPELVPCGD